MKVCDDLRAAVLQFALQGKLTIQEESDGDARNLLNCIKREKEAFFTGKKNKEKELPPILEDDIPFEIPQNWIWERWGNLSNSIQYGVNAGAQNTGNVKLVRISDVQNNHIVWEGVPFSNIKESDIEQYLLNENDILFARTGGTVGKSVIVSNLPSDGQKYVFAGYLIRTNYSSLIDCYYLKCFMDSELYWQQLKGGTIGSAQPNCNGNTLSQMIIPLPPLAEQHRIVAKVDELMEKIDELEKIENQLESLKEDFPGDMKAALLQAAMQGKLTEQLEDDGDAVGLAEVIKAERNKLGKNKYIKGNIEDANIPDSWTAIKSGECFSLEKGTNVKEVNLPYLEAKYLRGKVSATMMTEGEFVSKGEKVILVDGENSGEVFIEPEDGIIGSTFKVLFIPESINEKYALYFLDMYRDQFRNNKKGAAIPHLNKDIFNNLLLPIPPIEEQQRIVEKLDQLLPLCDGLCEDKLQEAM